MATWNGRLLFSFRQRLRDLAGDAAAIIAEQGFTELPISLRHAQVAGSLPVLHPDPFLRALVAQAIVSDLVVVSDHTAFDTYGVTRLW